MASTIAFPSPRIAAGSAPGTIVVHVYGQRAYRTATALLREDGVLPDKAAAFEVPADATHIWRVWPHGAITLTSVKAMALAKEGERVARVPILD